MRVLVVAASQHGTTWGIGATIRDRLRRHGLEVELVRPQDAKDLDDYDAVVLGSSLDRGRWLPSALGLVHRLSEQLEIPAVWLFSSDLTEDRSRPLDNPAHVVDLMRRVGARGHTVFRPNVDPEVLDLRDLGPVRSPEMGVRDIGDWDLVEMWSDRIAAVLRASCRGQAEGLQRHEPKAVAAGAWPQQEHTIEV